MEYNVDKTGITDTFKPLNETDLTGLVKFGTGTWEIRISWDGNQEFKGGSVTVEVTTTDSRAASTVALKEGVSFTYNMDVNAMKQAIFDNAIDWENSTLPAKETLSIDDFTIDTSQAHRCGDRSECGPQRSAREIPWPGQHYQQRYPDPVGPH